MCAEGVEACLPAHTTILRWKLCDFRILCAHIRLNEAFERRANGCVELGYEGGDLPWGVVRIRCTILHTAAQLLNREPASCLYSMAHMDCVIS